MSRLPLPFHPVVEQPWALLRRTLDALAVHVIDGAALAAAPPPQAPQRRREGTVALVTIRGVIEHRQTMLGELFGGTSVDSIRADFRTAIASPDVLAVVLDVDSPGGATDNVTELANEIRAARGSKPIVAIANGTAASAAYWIGTQADELYVTPSGQVGSVGIYAIHEDHSEELADAGVKVTILSAGEHKTDGNPYEPLTDEAKATLQKRVDAHYETFVADVAAGRGVTVAAVKAGFGQGATLMAKDALAEGMVDGIATLDQVIRNVARQTRATTSTQMRGDDAAPEPRAEQDDPDETTPFRVRVTNLRSDAALIVVQATAKAALRAKEGRTLSRAVLDDLWAAHAHLEAFLATVDPSGATAAPPVDPVARATPEPAVDPPVSEPRATVPTSRRFRSPADWDAYVTKGLAQ